MLIQFDFVTHEDPSRFPSDGIEMRAEALILPIDAKTVAEWATKVEKQMPILAAEMRHALRSGEVVTTLQRISRVEMQASRVPAQEVGIRRMADQVRELLREVVKRLPQRMPGLDEILR